jgi:hypothetical protein
MVKVMGSGGETFKPFENDRGPKKGELNQIVSHLVLIMRTVQCLRFSFGTQEDM